MSNTAPTEENRLTLLLLMIAAMVFWGGGWTANKLIVDSGSILVLSFWRFALTFLTLAPLFLFVRRSFRVSFKALRITFVSAALNLSFMIVAFWGVMHGTAGAAGVIITTLSPLITFMLMSFLFAHKISGRQLLGLFLGLVGGMVMLHIWDGSMEKILTGGNLYFLLAAALWALVTIFSQRSHLHMDPFVYSFILSGMAAALLFIPAYQHNLFFIFDQDMIFWAALIYISFFGQTVATTIYYFASGKLGSGSASSFMFIVPASTLFISWAVLGEIPAGELLVGGSISLLAVYIINKKGRRS